MLQRTAWLTACAGKLAKEAGAKLFLQSQQDIHMGGRQSNAAYQYTLQADDLKGLREWAPKVYEALLPVPELADTNTDQQDHGLQTSLVFDRDTIYKLGLNLNTVDSTLNDAFGQRQVSTIYNPLNPVPCRDGSGTPSNTGRAATRLKTTYVTTPGGAEVPLAAISTFGPTNTPLAVNHQGQFAAATVSFNLPPGVSLEQASNAITKTMRQHGRPRQHTGHVSGHGQAAFQDSLNSQNVLDPGGRFSPSISCWACCMRSYIHPAHDPLHHHAFRRRGCHPCAHGL